MWLKKEEMEFLLITALISVIPASASAANAATATATAGTAAAGTNAAATTAAAVVTATAFSAAKQEERAGIIVRMPEVRPTIPDSHICAGFKLGDAPTQVIGYDPLVDQSTVHHLTLWACETPGSKAPIWRCGLMGGLMGAKGGIPSGPNCAEGYRQQIIYGWANHASPMRLPDGVGIKLPASVTLVLKVHYANIDKYVQG